MPGRSKDTIKEEETNEVAEFEESLSALAEETQELRAEVMRRGTIIRDMSARMNELVKGAAPSSGISASTDSPTNQTALAVKLAQLQNATSEKFADLQKVIETKDALITRLQLELAEVQRHDADFRSKLQRLADENSELRATLADAAQKISDSAPQ